jgi:flagellar export protein FliJ
MRAFQFTLEALGTLRRRQEQNAMDQYVQSLIDRRKAIEQLEGAEATLNASWRQWRQQLAAGCSAAEAAQAVVYQRSLAQRRDECKGALENAERRVNTALNAMVQARRQREIVDKCFDKQKARYEREVARGEQKFIDELASRRGNRILAWKSAESTL